MIRSNSKEAKAAIRAYIMDIFSPAKKNKDKDFSTFEKVARHLKETCDHEASWIKNERNRMEYWIYGIPLELRIEKDRREKKELVRQWLRQTIKEANAYSDLDVFRKYAWLMTREIISCAR